MNKLEKQLDPTLILDRLDIKYPIIGLYNAPDSKPFQPLVKPSDGDCIFLYFKDWLKGKTLYLSKHHYGCGGCGRWMFGIQTRSRKDFIKFLVEGEGLKASHELMEKWIDSETPKPPKYPFFFVGPFKTDQWNYILSITFLVNPDQLSALTIGAQYFSRPSDVTPVITPFGSGCSELWRFDDQDSPQAVIGTTDIAMRPHIPPEILAFTVTKKMFSQLCTLDEKSFLFKPFLERLKKSRGGTLG